jgi:hypothetical protein
MDKVFAPNQADQVLMHHCPDSSGLHAHSLYPSFFMSHFYSCLLPIIPVDAGSQNGYVILQEHNPCQYHLTILRNSLLIGPTFNNKCDCLYNPHILGSSTPFSDFLSCMTCHCTHLTSLAYIATLYCSLLLCVCSAKYPSSCLFLKPLGPGLLSRSLTFALCSV